MHERALANSLFILEIFIVFIDLFYDVILRDLFVMCCIDLLAMRRLKSKDIGGNESKDSRKND